MSSGFMGQDEKGQVFPKFICRWHHKSSQGKTYTDLEAL